MEKLDTRKCKVISSYHTPDPETGNICIKCDDFSEFVKKKRSVFSNYLPNNKFKRRHFKIIKAIIIVHRIQKYLLA